MTNLANIPPKLRELKQFVIWKADKKPRNPRNDQLSDVSDPRKWDSFENACKAMRDYRAKGVGFVFTENDPYCGIDLDEAIDGNGNIDPEAQDIIDRLDSYTEVSQSGHGIHIIVRGKKPGGKSKSDKVEVYDQGRFFALTGDLWQDKGIIEDRQAELNSLYEEAFGEEKKKSEPITHEIYEGEGRNIACTREAGRLLNIYKDTEVVKRMVWAYNEAVCRPPLDGDECATTWGKSLEKWAKKESEQETAPKVPQVISARDLMDKDFPPLIFALPGIIPEGLTLLAGKPKAGKSFFALETAYSVALGRNLLDKSEIGKGQALVLGLEDGPRRLKDRIGKINDTDCVLKIVREEGGLRIVGNLGEEVPEGIDLASDWPRIGNGGIEELEKYLDNHPDVRLVVIDTIKRFTKKKGRGTTFDEDYDSVQPLQDLARKRRLPILGVCHTRKATADDALDTVSGTFGLTGGCDNILVLHKEGEADDGKEFRLSIIPRDMESRELALKFGKDCMWTLLGNADDYFLKKEHKDILELLEHEVLGPKEVAERLGMKEATARSTLWRMSKAGLLVSDKGKYRTAGR